MTVPLLTVALSVGIFLLDLLTPLGVAVEMLYVAPLWLAFRWPQRHAPLLFATVCTALIVLGLFLSPQGVAPWVAVFNRSMTVGILWLLALLMLQHTRKDEMLRQANVTLELQVEQRMAKLAEVNRAVHAELQERVHLEEALRQAHATVESQVEARSAELTKALKTLRSEIVEHQQAEQKLRESEERFRSVVESAPDAIIVADHKGRVLSWNQRAREFFGYRDEEVSGEPLTRLMPLRYHEAHRKGLERITSTGHSSLIGKTVELSGLRKDGGEFPIELSLAMWKAHEGTLYAGIIRDISERKQAERKLHESEERFRSIAEASPAPLAISRISDGLILYANERFAEMFGLASRQWSGCKATEFYVDLDDHRALLQTVRSQGHARNYEVLVKRRDGTPFWVTLSSRPVTLAGEDVLLTGFYDMTERRQVEEKLRTNEHQLRELLVSRERLAQDLHDHIIQSIYAIGLDLRECRRLIAADAQKAVQKLDHTIAGLNALIRDVRGYIATLETQRTERQDFTMAVARILESINAIGTMRWVLQMDPTVVRELGAAAQTDLLHTVQELVTNSLRHSKGRSGRVVLQRHDGNVLLEVTDDGVGFEVSAGEAHGHGLRNIAARAKHLGATIHLKSEVGHGTQIQIVIPRQKP